MCINLIKLGNDQTFEKITTLMFIEINNKIKTYNKEPNNHNFFLVKNYIIFFMIITLNLKNFPSYVKILYKGKKLFFDSLKNSIKKIEKKKNK